MEADKKAKDIYDKMKGFRVKNAHRKRCALICVDEVLLILYHNSAINGYRINYWQEVKQEIEKL